MHARCGYGYTPEYTSGVRVHAFRACMRVCAGYLDSRAVRILRHAGAIRIKLHARTQRSVQIKRSGGCKCEYRCMMSDPACMQTKIYPGSTDAPTVKSHPVCETTDRLSTHSCMDPSTTKKQIINSRTHTQTCIWACADAPAQPFHLCGTPSGRGGGGGGGGS